MRVIEATLVWARSEVGSIETASMDYSCEMTDKVLLQENFVREVVFVFNCMFSRGTDLSPPILFSFLLSYIS